jgi:hypothetical protein
MRPAANDASEPRLSNKVHPKLGLVQAPASVRLRFESMN